LEEEARRLLSEIEDWLRLLERYEAVRFKTTTDRFMITEIRRKIRRAWRRLEEILRKLEEVVRVFRHWTVVGNVDTATEYARLRASCTLDYDVVVEKEKEYYKIAVRKIYDWVVDMFNEKPIKFSSEVSKTLLEVAERLRKEGKEVSDIEYYWWWKRTGRTYNEEELEGVVRWDEPIPVGVAGGWFTTGRRRRR